ncbi:MAG: adenylate/guanylate cyclase domain-containing protein [Melioribacteraceae bacterium]|nr:adenylate/guanylate cyclase domain-containing protein [Melioribacteraceae bacterium]
MGKNQFEKEISKEILKNEKFRLQVLIGILAVLIPISVFSTFLFESRFKLIFKNPDYFLFAVGIIFLIITRSYFIRNRIGKWQKSKFQVPETFRYINAFIEVSILSAAILLMSYDMQSVQALVTPVVFLYFIFIILSALELNFKLSVFTGFVAASEFLILAIYLLNNFPGTPDSPLLNFIVPYIAKSVIIFLSGVVAGIVAVRIKKYMINSYERLDERNHIEKIFGQQVSPRVVDELVKSKQEIGSRRRFVCIMFLDIRGFTTFSENKSPEEIVEYQNNVFSFMINRVTENNGIINQFMGDGFMATFGAPVSHENDCQNAVDAAVGIIEDIKTKNENGEIPFTKIGIGIHAGEVVTGNVGTSVRKQYSITGNVVILASRLEQLNKEFNSQLLISKEVLDKVDSAKISLVEHGLSDIKGRTEPLEIFEIK